MNLTLIAAMDQNRLIGRDNDMPWHLPSDLRFFKRITLSKPLLMGRKTYESIGRPLPKRTNVIVTRNPYFIATNCLIAYSIEDALGMAFDNGEEEAFIIGGGQIYEQSQNLWDKVYLTEVDLEVEGDVYFPKLLETDWELCSEESHQPDAKNEYGYTFKIFERKLVKNEFI